MFDGTPDYEIASGRIRFKGATPISLVTDGLALKESDEEWGIPSVNYGMSRGLDGPDPSTHLPVDDEETPEAEFDLARLEEDDEGLSIRFWFGLRRDIDDFRILLRYPAENRSASMQLVLYHRRGPDAEGFPKTSNGGLQIGNIEEDICPDDGVYENEVFSIERLKLRVEDLDIVEEMIDLGRTDYRGGAIGPGIITIDNFSDGLDPDNDNGRDQNGRISPIPTSGPLNHIRYKVSVLTGPGGATIPASGVQVLDLPRTLMEGARSEGQLSVDAPPDLPEGMYTGTITVWEDNNLNGTAEVDEPQDSVTIRAEVLDDIIVEPDAFMMPDSDSSMMNLDAGIVDAATDAGRDRPQREAGASEQDQGNSQKVDMNPNRPRLEMMVEPGDGGGGENTLDATVDGGELMGGRSTMPMQGGSKEVGSEGV